MRMDQPNVALQALDAQIKEEEVKERGKALKQQIESATKAALGERGQLNPASQSLANSTAAFKLKKEQLQTTTASRFAKYATSSGKFKIDPTGRVPDK